MNMDDVARLLTATVSFALGGVFGWIQFRLFRSFMIRSVLEAAGITTLVVLAFGACLLLASFTGRLLGAQSDWTVLAPLVAGFLLMDRRMRIWRSI